MNETDTTLADVSAGAAPSDPVPTPAAPVKSVLIGRIAPEHLRDELLAEIFADTVRHRPHHAALETLERIYNYAEVDTLATGIARALLARGVRPGDVVGLWMARGPELLIAQIAIAKTGAAWLPFDADAPVDRISVCLNDAEAKGLLTSAEFALKADGHMPCPVLVDDAIVDPTDNREVDPRALGATPDHPAYMIYTSGSTGVPKGIVITGRNICHYLRSANELYGVAASDIVFQGASVAFDLSMEEIWIPYLVGATLFVATPQIMGEADKLPDILDDAGVTVLDTVPTLLAMLPKDAPKLRIIILGGEACPPAIAARWCKPGRSIFNSYGPTEATVVATAAPVEEQEEPRTQTEAALLEAAKRTLPPQAMPFDADFFTDLGGHSLLAARFVSAVRETPRLASITLQDVYNLRSLRAISAHLDGKADTAGEARDLSFEPPPFLRRFLCGLAQAIALPFILGLMTAQWLGVFVSYMLLTDPDASLLSEIVALLGVYLCINLATILISIAAKWLLLGRTKPGRYPLWGSYYFRWWLAQHLMALCHIKWFQASPIMRLYLSAMGAKIGEDALISEVEAGAIDLVTIGAGASLGTKLKLANARVVGNELIIGRIDIGADAYVGTSCVIEEGCVIGQGAELKDLTSVPAGTQIGAHEIWDGSPARKVGHVDESELPAPATTTPGRRALHTFLYTVLLLVIPPLGLLPIFPAFWVFDRMDSWLDILDRTYYLAAIPLFAWPTSFALVILTVGFIAVVRWAILPRVKEGVYSVHSWFYLRKWAVALATEVTLETLSSLFATVYMRTWYRLMGAGIGKDSEISTNLSGRYDIVDIGDKCFIADEVVLGDEDIRRGWMTLASVKTGSRVFVGNDGVVPPGANIPTGALIGIKSKPPANELMSEGDTWFGSPPIKLPVRQKFDGGGANWTYEPPWWKKFMRATFEAVHISLPTMLYITFGTWAVQWFGQTILDRHYGAFLFYFIVSSVNISMAMTGVVIGIKWATMGRYQPQVQPMWSFWAMRTEAVAVMYWGLAGRVFLDHLRGTPFLPWTLRLFGAKIGKGVYMDMTDITEFDCVTVGDFCALNSLCALQTHLYEDRVMKVGRVNLGRGVTVGAGSTVLYDTQVGDYAQLGPLTLVMKGESIPTNSEWIGAPAEPRAREKMQAATAA